MNNLEIKLCPQCEGHGELKIDDNHSNVDSVICNNCEGLGRIYYRHYEVNIPITQKNRMYAIDEEIISILRKTKNQT